MKSNKHAGQFKLRGKKAILLSCRCCTVENWKEDCRKREAEKEMRLFSRALAMVDSLPNK